ncbi:MAG: CHASE2 and HATPase_c domain-containing protein [Gammaproteobacteria bacterium]
MRLGGKTSSLRPVRLHRQPARRRWAKAAILAAFTAVIGVVILSSFGYYLEEDGGLRVLFHLRGPRPAPANVVIVSLDRASSERLDLPYDYSNWPHSYHARLIQKLIDAGASVIGFDVFFTDKKQLTDDDQILASTIRRAGNVVLVEDLHKQIIPMENNASESASDSVIVEQLVPPSPVLAQAAASIAPFPLPKVPVRVSRYWTFEQTGDIQTFPAAVFQVFALQTYDDLRVLLSTAVNDPQVASAGDAVNKLALVQAEKILSLDRSGLKRTRALITLSRCLKDIFGSDTLIAADMRAYLQGNVAPTPIDARHREILRALVDMYRAPDSRYLNFYGPPRSIRTVSYYQALQAADQNGSSGGNSFDFKGKVVFIGYSDIAPQNQGDFYNTVYSLPDGRDLSGVEIAATAFANLMEDTPIRPLPFGTHVLIILLYGIVMGLICYLLRPLLAMVCVAAISILYVDLAAVQFSAAAIWFPIMVPLAVQAPFAFTASILWKYYDSRKTEVAHERLREVDRLKSMFLSQVSHELKAPLTSIQGFVENMLDGMTGELHGKQREYLQRMRENTERLTRMITNLLDLSRIESGTQHINRVPWPLFGLVEEVIRQFETVAQAKHVTLSASCEDPALKILADHDKFVQILTNLVDNAIKFTHAGGKVTVSLARHDANNAVLTIADTGAGIPVEAMEHLFEPFYQASQGSRMQVKGLGLGLSIVKSLVEIHGGTISVSTELGRGSEFRILLPVLAAGDHEAFYHAANS